MNCTRAKVAAIVSVVIAVVLAALWLGSLWIGVACVREAERWSINAADGTQALHTTRLAFDLSRGSLNFTRSQALSQIGAIGSVPTSLPAGGWDFAFFPARSQRERSWDRHWFVDRWDHWRLGGLGWYESAGGGSISRILSIPLWMLILSAGVPGLLMARVCVRTSRRRARGQCVRCGYRLGPAQAACPECGRRTSVSPSRAPAGPPSPP